MNRKENVHAISNTDAAKRYIQAILLFYNAYTADSVPCATDSATAPFLAGAAAWVSAGPASPSFRAHANPPKSHRLTRSLDV